MLSVSVVLLSDFGETQSDTVTFTCQSFKESDTFVIFYSVNGRYEDLLVNKVRIVSMTVVHNAPN
jgi:hypothetical protein